RIHARELHCFVGANYVVTVHHEPMPALATARVRWRQAVETVTEGIGFLVYTIMDSVVDEYFPLLDRLNEGLEELETRVLQNAADHTSQQIFRLKKNLLHLRKILAPKRDIFNILSRRDQPLFPAQTQFFLRDVYDHLLRILEQVDTQREMAAGLLEAYLSAVANRTNVVMKTLTVAATILMTLSLVAGIYGMNFEHMPELKWRYGYTMALGIMVAVSVVMGLLFRRKKWF
ncbi:MAG: magnesium/cobalt transporter CorA, partial [Deltaproteobacteria bacterium]|nr:magnesium/cobalt transporter CorA [Deltaproteobacteria bacterium]